MAEKLSLEVVTPEKIVLSEEDAEMVVSPGELGDFGVLKGHTPFLTSLRLGALRFVDKKGREETVFIKGGFAEALPGKVTILADAAELKENIDEARAREAKERAELRLNGDMPDEKTDYERARQAHIRAETRLKISLL
ncbi:MAG: ATP synthase F1 subunit epsilon [Thermodesulfobacteriota bacterium]